MIRDALRDVFASSFGDPDKPRKPSKAALARKMAALRARAAEIKARKRMERLYGETVNSYLATLRGITKNY